jgi:hypothetical protein
VLSGMNVRGRVGGKEATKLRHNYAIMFKKKFADMVVNLRHKLFFIVAKIDEKKIGVQVKIKIVGTTKGELRSQFIEQIV